MGPTTEGTGIVDETIAAGEIEERTCPRRILGQLRPADGADCPGCQQRFALGKIRRAAGELEMAAFLYAHAIPLDRTQRKVGVNRAYFIQGALDVRIRNAGAVHRGKAGSLSAIACPAIQPVVHAA